LDVLLRRVNENKDAEDYFRILLEELSKSVGKCSELMSGAFDNLILELSNFESGSSQY